MLENASWCKCLIFLSRYFILLLLGRCVLHQLLVIWDVIFLVSSALPKAKDTAISISRYRIIIFLCLLWPVWMYTMPSLLQQSMKSTSLIFLCLLLRVFGFIFWPTVFPFDSAITPQRLKQWWSTLCALCMHMLNWLHWKIWLKNTCWIWSLACSSEF